MFCIMLAAAGERTCVRRRRAVHRLCGGGRLLGDKSKRKHEKAKGEVDGARAEPGKKGRSIEGWEGEGERRTGKAKAIRCMGICCGPGYVLTSPLRVVDSQKGEATQSTGLRQCGLQSCGQVERTQGSFRYRPVTARKRVEGGAPTQVMYIICCYFSWRKTVPHFFGFLRSSNAGSLRVQSMSSLFGQSLLF